MALPTASDNLFPKLLIRESADDGSDFSNPAADYRVLYLGEDGFLHVKDSAGGVSEPFDPSGGGIAEGSSFPGSPSSGDLFHRTDLQPALWRYDGTRWRCTCIHEHYLGQFTNVSATTSELYTPVRPEALDMWLIDLVTNMLGVTLSGTQYWTFEFYSYTSAGGTLRASTNNQSGSNNVHARKVAALDALLGSTVEALSVRSVKTSTPGNFTGGAMLTYQLVAT